MSEALQPHGLEPTRLLCSWDSPGKNTGMGCHFLLQGSSPTRDRTCVFCTSCIGRQILYHWATREANYCTAAAAAKSLQSCPTLCDPRDGSPPGSPVPGILQARILEWVAIVLVSPKNKTKLRVIPKFAFRNQAISIPGVGKDDWGKGLQRLRMT